MFTSLKTICHKKRFFDREKKEQKSVFSSGNKNGMFDELRFLKSKRGKDICIHNGFVYNIIETTSQTSKYRCKDRKCRGFVVFGFDNVITGFKEHNHLPNIQDVKKLDLLYLLKQKSETVLDVAEEIIHNSIRALSCNEETIKCLPKLKSLKDSIKNPK